MESHNVELRKLPQNAVFDLSRILDEGDCWKQLMALIPDQTNGDRCKYTVEHMNLIENASVQQKRSCSEILFDEWGTSGEKRPFLTDLLLLLVKAQLFRAADYVSVQLLKQEPPERPTSGPAAPVKIPDVLPAPQVPSILIQNPECAEKTLIQQSTTQSGVPYITYEELEKGTEGFSESRMLGSGGFGAVYLCILNGRKTAVKIIKNNEAAALPGITIAQFKNELRILEELSHPNLLPLAAYSTDGPLPCLVYEFMSNGSLQDAIECRFVNKVLEWQERLDIALGTAKGLEYLHTWATKPLVHRDIKSANVLLDENLVAKIGDFGLAKQGTLGKVITVNTSTVVGTTVYMAPEALRGGSVSVKGDVYSFGVVLLEIITGLPPYDETREDGCDLVSYVEEIDDISSLVDKRPNIANDIIPEQLNEIAEKCLLEKKNRPYSTDIVKFLEEVSMLIRKN